MGYNPESDLANENYQLKAELEAMTNLLRKALEVVRWEAARGLSEWMCEGDVRIKNKAQALLPDIEKALEKVK